MSKTIYIIVLLFAIVSLLIVCGKDKPTEPTHETNPPTLLYTSPANTATNIEVDAVISATFSEPIDSVTVNATNFIINNGLSGNYSLSGNTIYFTPSDSMIYSTTYSCQLTTGLTDSVGNNLASAFSWSFTTEPDPATTLPTVVSVTPFNNATNIYGDAVITATFSKEIDESTLNGTSFYLNNGAIGVVTYSNKIATLTPDDTLLYDTSYIATITTAVADTFGNNLLSAYIWNFRTISDPFIPLLSFTHPFDSAIVDDTVTIVAAVSHPVGVDSVEFYIDDAIVSSATDMTEPYEYLLDASLWEIGSLHDVSTKAYYGPSHVGYSDTIEIIYLWEEMAVDDNLEGMPQDLRRVFARSSDSALELRYEFGKNWSFPYPRTEEQINDSIINLGIYLDTDVNSATGDLTLGDPGIPLNGIGADHRIILSSLIGAARDTALAFWNGDQLSGYWDLVYDTTGFNYHNVPLDTNYLEFGINWSDLDNSPGAYIMSFHFYFVDATLQSGVIDWLPNQGSGYITVAKDGRYIGAPFSAGKVKPSTKPRSDSPNIKFENNPFK